jgi:uncharacterized membrane protein
MAGIGFTLKKIQQGQSFYSDIKAYSIAALISGGPWIITILVIAMLQIIDNTRVSLQQFLVFKTTIVYIYALSLILTGPFQLPLTRFLSDRLYLEDEESFSPSFSGVTVANILFQAPIAFFLIFKYTQWDFFYSVTAFILYILVCQIWTEMIFLSAARDYKAISFSFIAAGTVSFVLAWYFSADYGLKGMIAGYTIGQAVLSAVLGARIYLEFPSGKNIDFSFLKYLLKYPELTAAGLFYNLGIWLDKFVFWFSLAGNQVDSVLRASYIYDSPMFFAYLTTLPALALFMVRVETDFMLKYRNFYSAITGGATLQTIMQLKKRMFESFRVSAASLGIFQGGTALILSAAAPVYIPYLRLSWAQLGILRIGILGALVQVLLLSLFIVILYFEFRVTAMLLALLFAVLNGLFAWYSIQAGQAWYGHGYFWAALITLGAAMFAAVRQIGDILYYTFMKQPV